LLIIKQSPGIDYNSLVARIASNYGSVNSARAALSRAVKDMNAIGLIEKKENRFFATEKGQIQIHSEMKSKLVIKLNQTVLDKNNVEEIGAIVEQLAVLIERSKADSDLLKAAKGAITFSLSDLRNIQEHVNKRLNQLHYLQEIFQKQIDALQQLDFLDSVSFPFNAATAEKLRLFFQQNESTELLLNSSNDQQLEELAGLLGEKTKSGTIQIPKNKMDSLFQQLLQKNGQNNFETTLRLAGFTVRIQNQKTTITGSFSQLEETKKRFT
jgi:hypothetical protein